MFAHTTQVQQITVVVHTHSPPPQDHDPGNDAQPIPTPDHPEDTVIQTSHPEQDETGTNESPNHSPPFSADDEDIEKFIREAIEGIPNDGTANAAKHAIAQYRRMKSGQKCSRAADAASTTPDITSLAELASDTEAGNLPPLHTNEVAQKNDN